MNWLRRRFPFNAEQTLNVSSEMGPIVTMFVVNFVWGVEAGVWSLIVTTVLALAVSLVVFRRPPIMPFIAGAVTVTFGALTLYTGDEMWVQIKVTLFNALVALLLWLGLRRRQYFFEFVFGKTFHYTDDGWYELTRNAAIFFFVTAVANEAVRLGFDKAAIPCPEAWLWLLKKPVLHGIDIWMIFKLFVVMPLTTLFFVWQVRSMQKYRIPAPVEVQTKDAPH
ncbi:MAG TPA: septation protein IspZ [Hyphomicrobiaceae bacterium]|nr:septation protein IspZ [Hyphomicrobiaceae bacterium]